MARIRSVHPGLFTDESFASLSSDAQMFLIGLWTEADDQGVFEWKPITLRMRLRPTKDGDVTVLLEEISSVNCIMSFDSGGKKYGAIRNFRKFQRPKSPNAIYPAPANVKVYVGLTDGISEIGGDDAPSFPQTAEIGPQMEDVGDKGNNPPIPPCHISEPEDTGDWLNGLGSVDRILVAVWMQTGATKDDCLKWLTSTKGQGRDKVAAWLKLGSSVDEIVAKITAIFDEAEHRGQPINQAWPYLDKAIKAWAADQKRAQQVSGAAPETPWHNRVTSFRDNGTWLPSWGPRPGEQGCHVPPQILSEFGYQSERAA